VLVAHRLSTIKNADKICVLGDGKVHESGTHDELLRNADGPYARLVHQQLTKAANDVSEAAFNESAEESKDQ
jgi:ATP-binding cassette subfamily B (MDR/TAP) protein 1